MKPLAALLLSFLLVAGNASAQQRGSLTLAWDECRTTGGANVEYSACNTNSNTASRHNLIGGYLAGNNVNELIAWSGNIDVFNNDMLVPPWWQHGAPPACRGTDDLTIAFTSSSGVSCFDYQSQVLGGAFGARTYTYPSGQSNHALIRFVAAVNSEATLPTIPFGTETYLLSVSIRNGNTVAPDPICAGCRTPAVLTFVRLDLEQRNGDNFSVIYQSLQDPEGTHRPDAASVGWQKEQMPTPTRNRTWGSIKSIYR